MEFKVAIDSKTREALEALAEEQGKTVDEIATAAFKAGMENFLEFGVPPRAH